MGPAGAVEAGVVGLGDHRGARRPVRAGRARPAEAGVAVRVTQDVGAPAARGITVARCTVERLMRANGWVGVRRAKQVRTTTSDPAADRAPDLVDRQFRVSRPDELFVADFTYVPMSTGVFAYTAFVIDAFAGTIVGWECSTSKATAFVERAIRQAADKRRREGHPLPGSTIHHSDAGSQGGFNWSSQHLESEVGMGRPAGWMSALTGRSPMKSPGAPAHRREVQRQFWVEIAKGSVGGGRRGGRRRVAGGRCAVVPTRWRHVTI